MAYLEECVPHLYQETAGAIQACPERRDVHEKKTITHELAARMVAAAIARAQELGARQSVAVLDEDGNLKAFGRMDGAPILGIEGCQRKAYTALYGMSTEALYQRIKDDPSCRGRGSRQPRRHRSPAVRRV